jgi:hypothetical protein
MTTVRSDGAGCKPGRIPFHGSLRPCLLDDNDLCLLLLTDNIVLSFYMRCFELR